MKELRLLADPPPAGRRKPAALWNGGPELPGDISIEEMLSKRLIQIRTEHMQWAYATGCLKVGASNLASLLECGQSPSMWWTSLIYERHPKQSPDLFPVYKLRCVELLLQEGGYDTLLLSGGDRRMRKVLANLCQAHGVKFSHVAGKEPEPCEQDWKRRLYRALPAPMRSMLRLAHWQLAVRRKLPFAPELEQAPQDGRKSATIVTYFPNIDMRAAGEGRFRSRYWEKLHDALNHEARAERPEGPHFVRWLFIRFPAPDLTLQDCLRLRDLFQKKGEDGLSFKFLEEYLSSADIGRAIWRWLKLSLQALKLRPVFRKNCHTKGSLLNFWPYMRYDWGESLAGWRCLERCLFNLAFNNYAKAAGSQRWNLYPLENCAWERMFTEACRRVSENGRVIGAQHSTIRPTDFRYFDAPETFTDLPCASFQPDLCAGNGASACSQWQDNQMPKERLAMVEALRYLYLAREARDREDGSCLPPAPGLPLRPDKDKRLLVLTSFFRDETYAHLELFGQALAQGLFAGWGITLKPHPYLMPADWLDSLPAEQRRQIFISHAPLSQELAPNVLVWASNSTTASLEAAIKGLRLMVMKPHNDFDLCPIQNMPGLMRTGSLEDVRRCLASRKRPELAPDYLDLDEHLVAWCHLLGLHGYDCHENTAKGVTA